jgi:hypothetical protein
MSRLAGKDDNEDAMYDEIFFLLFRLIENSIRERHTCSALSVKGSVSLS